MISTADQTCGNLVVGLPVYSVVVYAQFKTHSNAKTNLPYFARFALNESDISYLARQAQAFWENQLTTLILPWVAQTNYKQAGSTSLVLHRAKDLANIEIQLQLALSEGKETVVSGAMPLANLVQSFCDAAQSDEESIFLTSGRTEPFFTRSRIEAAKVNFNA